MTEGQQDTGNTDNYNGNTWPLDKVNQHNRAKSVPLNVSFDNRPETRPSGEIISFYGRLLKYSKHKGVGEQEIIRFAVSMLLDKVGY